MKTENCVIDPSPFGGICPACNGTVTFYATAEDKKSGRYRCNNCSRDTIWKQLKTTTIEEVIANIKARESENGI